MPTSHVLQTARRLSLLTDSGAARARLLHEADPAVGIYDTLRKAGLLGTSKVDLLRRDAESRRLGPFRILRLLGQGGMGIVYKAARGIGGEPVAVKVLHARYHPEPQLRRRLEREARALASIRHPHIVRGLGYGWIEERFYIAMEYVDGRSLADAVRRRRLDVADAARVGRAVGSALGELDARGFVHRDVKPENVMLARDGRVVLMDLGLAKQPGAGADLTRPGTTLGTPNYMSPEQIEGRPDLDVRSDLYGLGATLYFALTGLKPFAGARLLDMMRCKLAGPPDPRRVRPDLPRRLARVVAACMAPDRRRRFADATHFLRALETACTPPWWRRWLAFTFA
jgi:serine/threonine protein kinase